MEQEICQLEESPGDFLDSLGTSLVADADVDQELAAILATHLLQAAPATDAAARAQSAIRKLASARASETDVEKSDG